jgi:hypothetical protein
MTMQCPECHKFPAFDDSNDPEVNGLEVDEDGHVSASVRIVLTCAEDSTELKEATFDVEADVPSEFAEAHHGNDHELSVEEGSFEQTSRVETEVKPRGYHAFAAGDDLLKCNVSMITRKGTAKACGKAADARVHKMRRVPMRFAKSYRGFHGNVTVTCSCGASVNVDLEDEMQSSSMDEMI